MEQVTGRITGAYRAGHPGSKAPGWCITFDYDEDVITELKNTVPLHERSYNPDTHEWFVTAAFEDDLLRLFPGLEAYRQQLSLFE